MRRLIASLAVAAATLGIPVVGSAPAGAQPSPDCSAELAPHVNLSGCDLRGADLSGADLSFANLSSAKLKGADVTDTDFTGANLNWVRSGSLVGDPYALPTNWIVESGFLVGPSAVLIDADLSGSDLSALVLKRTIFLGGKLTDTDFTGSDLGRARFYGVDMTRTILTDAYLQRAKFVGDTLAGTLMDGANMGSALLRRSTLTNVDLRGSDWSNIRIVGDLATSGLRGTPGNLPGGWSIVGGVLYWYYGQ